MPFISVEKTGAIRIRFVEDGRENPFSRQSKGQSHEAQRFLRNFATFRECPQG
jgi:hypothetical protein